MDMLKPKFASDHIHSVGYDNDTGTLAVQFHRGGVYHYPGVDEGTYLGLQGAASAGSFFHRQIKGRYKGIKV